MEFSRQEYWDSLPCPAPGDFPNPEIEPVSLASPALADRFFTTALPGKSTTQTLVLVLLSDWYNSNVRNTGSEEPLRSEDEGFPLLMLLLSLTQQGASPGAENIGPEGEEEPLHLPGARSEFGPVQLCGTRVVATS